MVLADLTWDRRKPCKRSSLTSTGPANERMLKTGLKVAPYVPNESPQLTLTMPQCNLTPSGIPFHRVSMDTLGLLPETGRRNQFILLIGDLFIK